MEFRTDLAIEKHENLGKKIPDGITSKSYKKNNVSFHVIDVCTEESSKEIEKPIGTYITAEFDSLIKNGADYAMIESIAEQIVRLIPKEGTVLVAGLGNTEITPDAIGPNSVSMLLATRHIGKELSKEIGLENLRSVAVFTPGVLGKTGIETAESIKGIVDSINPTAVIVVDALAARRMSRLGTTLQMSDTGIVPGSGVGNSRSEISRKTVGVPVISIGIPTVVDVQTLVNDISGKEIKVKEGDKNMIITPREIDIVVQRASELIGLAINRALQPTLSINEIMMLVGN